MYDVNYFIKKFEAIPEEMWTTGNYVDEQGLMCALGHCGALQRYASNCHSEESKALSDMVGVFLPDINDGDDDRYQQPTPKQRILAALRDVKNEVY